MSKHLAIAYPRFAARVKHVSLADLPTPVTSSRVRLGNRHGVISIKHDDVTSLHYGGNKVRKLEFLLQRANDHKAKRIATFGAVASNHAVATALYAAQSGYECTCFLSHQRRTPGAAKALRFHQQNGTEVVQYGGDRKDRVQTLRRFLLGRGVSLIPLGGTSWLGSIGFVNAGLEIAAQIEAGEIPRPARIYVALGTMGTAAGLALGLVLAGLDTELHAVRVTDKRFANRAAFFRLMHKTARLMHAIDPTIPGDLGYRTRVVIRDEFFGDGYARSNDATERAVAFAEDELSMTLERTYTGKTMAAILADLSNDLDSPVLFWNTYNSRPMHVDDQAAPDWQRLPAEFRRYFD